MGLSGRLDTGGGEDGMKWHSFYGYSGAPPIAYILVLTDLGLWMEAPEAQDRDSEIPDIWKCQEEGMIEWRGSQGWELGTVTRQPGFWKIKRLGVSQGPRMRMNTCKGLF